MAAREKQERRWIILGEDGRYVSLGRDSDPTEEEILKVEAMLKAQGISGWLAVLAGSPFENSIPGILEVKPLANPTQTFCEARAAFIKRLKSRAR